jgi:hypothetical protein
MFSGKKAQAALEYLTTYGWAILTALVALGALSYFGFMNPTALMPDKCDFGKQLECVDYMIQGGEVKIMLNNNFGKEIQITGASGENLAPSNLPLTISPGSQAEIRLSYVPLEKAPPHGDKVDVTVSIAFQRSDVAGSPSHSLIGSMFTTVQ